MPCAADAQLDAPLDAAYVTCVLAGNEGEVARGSNNQFRGVGLLAMVGPTVNGTHLQSVGVDEPNARGSWQTVAGVPCRDQHHAVAERDPIIIDQRTIG